MKKILQITFIIFCIYSKSNAQNPQEIYLEKSAILIQKLEYEKAIEVLNIGIDSFPNFSNLYNHRGLILNIFGLYDEAIIDFTIAIGLEKQDTSKANFLSNRGRAYYNKREFENAYIDLKEAITLDTSNINLYNNYAAICNETERINESIQILNKLLSIDSTYAPALINIGFKYQSLDKHKQAIKYFDKAIKFAPLEPLAYSNRSYSKLWMLDIKGAMKDINISLDLFPTNSYAHKVKALIYFERRDKDNACKSLDNAVRLNYEEQYGNDVNELIKRHCYN